MKSKILFTLLFIAIAISVYLTYDRTIVRNDFETFSSEEEFSEDEGEVGEIENPILEVE